MERKRIGLALCGLDCHWFLIVIPKRPTDRWLLKSTACLSRSRSEFNGQNRTGPHEGVEERATFSSDEESQCVILIVGRWSCGRRRRKSKTKRPPNQPVITNFFCVQLLPSAQIAIWMMLPGALHHGYKYSGSSSRSRKVNENVSEERTEERKYGNSTAR